MVLLDCLPLTGPVVVVKRKGTCYCTRTRGVSTSTETLPYIAPVPTLPIGQTCSHSHPVGDQEHISFLYGSTTLTLALPKIPRSIDKAYSKPHTAPSYCTIVLHHRTAPSSAGLPNHHTPVPRIIRCESSHLHRAVPFSVTMSCRIALSSDSGRCDPPAVKPSCIFQQPPCMNDAYAMRGNHGSVGGLISILCRFLDVARCTHLSFISQELELPGNKTG